MGGEAGSGAGLETDAAPQGRDRGPAGHRVAPVLRNATRTMSAPDPVASVWAIDMLARVLRLGT